MTEQHRIFSPGDAKASPRYAGLSTFARLPQMHEIGGLEAADVAVLGVPFDSGVSYRPGARFGPAHIRQSSRLLRPYNPELAVLPFDSQQVVDAGDIACSPFSIPEALASIEQGVAEVLSAGAAPLLLGGDHTIALPSLRAVHRVDGPVAVLHFDAHLDTNDNYFGEKYTHGTPFRRAREEGLLDQDACAHVGTRGPQYPEELSDDRMVGFQVFTSVMVDELGVAGTLERLRARVGRAPLYVSVDIDVLDPAHAPGTGTPEAGGLTSRELLRLLRGLAGLNVVGADIVEVAPAYDHAEVTGIAASHVAYELLSVLAANRRTTT